MADTDKTKKPRIGNWLDAPLRVKLGSTALLLLTILIVLGVWVGFAFPWWNASRYITEYTPNPEQVLRNLVWLFGSIFGGSLAVLGFVNAIHRTQQKDRELDADRRSVDAEIFAKSVEQLGHEKMAIRLGGLYSLENLARSAQALPLDADNQAYLNSLLETLAAFVRMRAPIPPEDKQSEDDKVATDVEAAVRIISRAFAYDLREKIRAEVDLRNCYLPRLEMPDGADMQNLYFQNTVLYGSTLPNANLKETKFINANLSKVFLDSADLDGAWLENADLTAAWLGSASMTDAKLIFTNLTKAKLYHVNFTQAWFDNVILTDTMLPAFTGGDERSELTAEQASRSLWNPDHPPKRLGRQKLDDLQTAINLRTKEIRDDGLWEEYLSEREKDEI